MDIEYSKDSIDKALREASEKMEQYDRKATDYAGLGGEDKIKREQAQAVVTVYRERLLKANIPIQDFELMAVRGGDPYEIESAIRSALEPFRDKIRDDSALDEAQAKAMKVIYSRMGELTKLRISPAYLELLAREGASEADIQKIIELQSEYFGVEKAEAEKEQLRIQRCRWLITMKADELRARKVDILPLEWLVSVERYSYEQLYDEIGRRLK